MISLNILGLPVPDVPALLDWCAAAKPPYIVVIERKRILEAMPILRNRQSYMWGTV